MEKTMARRRPSRTDAQQWNLFMDRDWSSGECPIPRPVEGLRVLGEGVGKEISAGDPGGCRRVSRGDFRAGAQRPDACGPRSRPSRAGTGISNWPTRAITPISSGKSLQQSKIWERADAEGQRVRCGWIITWRSGRGRMNRVWAGEAILSVSPLRAGAAPLTWR